MAIQFPKSTALSSLSMTPLIDIVFLLLIFFLVATRFEEEERDFEVKLPQASEAQPTIAARTNLIVSLSPAGKFILKGKEIELAELEATLQESYRNNPGRQRVTIRADKQSQWQYVVGAMNACSKANIQDYSVATE